MLTNVDINNPQQNDSLLYLNGTWTNNPMSNVVVPELEAILTTKADLLTRTQSSLVRQPVGADNQQFRPNSTTATGWEFRDEIGFFIHNTQSQGPPANTAVSIKYWSNTAVVNPFDYLPTPGSFDTQVQATYIFPRPGIYSTELSVQWSGTTTSGYLQIYIQLTDANSNTAIIAWEERNTVADSIRMSCSNPCFRVYDNNTKADCWIKTNISAMSIFPTDATYWSMRYCGAASTNTSPA